MQATAEDNGSQADTKIAGSHMKLNGALMSYGATGRAVNFFIHSMKWIQYGSRSWQLSATTEKTHQQSTKPGSNYCSWIRIKLIQNHSRSHVITLSHHHIITSSHHHIITSSHYYIFDLYPIHSLSAFDSLPCGAVAYRKQLLSQHHQQEDLQRTRQVAVESERASSVWMMGGKWG